MCKEAANIYEIVDPEDTLPPARKRAFMPHEIG